MRRARHLEDGIALAHEIGRPYLEVTGLAFLAQLTSWRSFPLGAERSLQAIDARRAARLVRRAGRRRRLRGPRRGDGRPGTARGGGAGARPGRAHRQDRSRAGRRDAAALRPRHARVRVRPSRRRPARLPGRRTVVRLPRHAAHARPAAALAPAAGARTPAARPHRVEQALADMDRAGAGPGRDSHRRGVAAARPARPAGGGPSCSRPSSTARLRCRTPTCGMSRRSCSRRSPATRSATRVAARRAPGAGAGPRRA